MKKDQIVFIVSNPTILHAFLKKSTLNPSGPGAFYPYERKGTSEFHHRLKRDML
jgi:hypothetical protein